VKTWLRRHREALFESLARFRRTPLASVLTVAVIGITLALPGGLYLAVDNAQRLGRGWEANGQVSLFLKPDVGEADAQKLAAKIRRLAGVAQVAYVSRAQALAEFKRHSGFGEALSLLDRNPLPAVLVVQPAPLAPEALAKLAAELGRQPGVDFASLDLDWVRRLHAMLGAAQRAVLILAGLLGLAVLIIVGNTVRLAVLSRREEIEITKLVGGTDSFIRRPFLYAGWLAGTLGGVVAFLLVGASLLILSGPARELAALYGTHFEVAGLGALALYLPLGGAALGWVGSRLAVGRHLRAIEPK
jgi:cell division transport system permease protein